MRIFRFMFSVFISVFFAFNLVSAGLAAAVQKLSSYTLDNLPEFNAVPYVKINDGNPGFTKSDYTETAFESYSPLDELGRCGTAYALVCSETMPTDERGSISSVTPSGWVQNKYETSVVDGGYIYNRCHLIGWQLTGENANKLNLITGTRYLNISGMLGFENDVADYVKSDNGHVLYRVTPIFEGSELLARGVLMEGLSVDDSGSAVCFCVFCYNVQPGITIDYKTGANRLTVEIIIDTDGRKYVFILNTNSRKYHAPGCASAESTKKENRLCVTGEKLCPEKDGYSPCGKCHPDENPVLLGDADGNGTVTVTDARLVLRCSIKLDDFSAFQLRACDTDFSDEISISDARTVLRIAIKLE